MVHVNRIIRALETVLELAQQSALDPNDCESAHDVELSGEAERHQQAIAEVNFFMNQLDTGALRLKEPE